MSLTSFGGYPAAKLKELSEICEKRAGKSYAILRLVSMFFFNQLYFFVQSNVTGKKGFDYTKN